MNGQIEEQKFFRFHIFGHLLAKDGLVRVPPVAASVFISFSSNVILSVGKSVFRKLLQCRGNAKENRSTNKPSDKNPACPVCCEFFFSHPGVVRKLIIKLVNNFSNSYVLLTYFILSPEMAAMCRV